MIASVTLNGLQILGVSQYDVLTPIEGLESPDMRATAYNRAGEDGGVLSALLYGQRAITITGLVKGTTCANHEAARQALQAACRIVRDAYDYPQPVALTIVTNAGSTYTLDVYVVKYRNSAGSGKVSEFFISLVAPDFRIYGAALSAGPVGLASGGGFIGPFIGPIVSSPSSGGSLTIVNNGDLETPPMITFTGQLTNPFIANVTTQETFQLNHTILPGETVTIDMLDKTVLLNGSTDLLYQRAATSSWFKLAPGANLLQLSSGSSGDTGTMSIAGNHAYLGV